MLRCRFRSLCLPIVAGVLAVAGAARADVRLPKIIGDHMVLQREGSAPIWGWAEPGEDVTVAIAGQTQKTKAGENGKWLVELDKIAAAGPHVLTVKGKNT